MKFLILLSPLDFLRFSYYNRAVSEQLRQRINELIAEIARGNTAALDELARLVSARMLSVARSVLRDAAAAEDAVQDSFIKILEKSNRFKPDTNGYAWICKIVYNTALNIAKRERVTVDISECFDLSDGTNVSERATVGMTVEKAMSVLDGTERRVIYQKYFMDFTVRDSAKALGLSKSKVSRTVLAAEEKMRKFMNAHDAT